MQLRHMEIVCDRDKLKVDIQQTCMKYKTIKQWAYILHDKDDTRPHYHIYLNFHPTSANTADVAKWFRLGYTDEQGNVHSGENFIERVKGRKSDVLLYLIHGNDSQRFKHQYSPTSVVSNFDFESEIATAKVIGDFENYSYAQQLGYINTLPTDEKTKAFSKLEKLWKIYCQTLTLKSDRNIDVVFVCGKAGTGKTYYAKKFLEQLGYDYCISSSSNDPFQDYLGQKAIILDDFRDKSDRYEDGFAFADFLKLTDNYTNSSVKSRFNNKVFNGKMIIITSSKPLCLWYTAQRMNADDSLEQLYRRITCYIEVSKHEIRIFSSVGKDGKPAGPFRSFVNDIPQLVEQSQQRLDFGEVFSKVCTENPPLDVQAIAPLPARRCKSCGTIMVAADTTKTLINETETFWLCASCGTYCKELSFNGKILKAQWHERDG